MKSKAGVHPAAGNRMNDSALEAKFQETVKPAKTKLKAVVLAESLAGARRV